MPAVERHDEHPGFCVTWYVIEPRTSVLCRLGLHRRTTLRASGFTGYFKPVARYRCPCARREWLRYNRTIVRCERVEPRARPNAARAESGTGIAA